jgi:hypothetical protein
MTLSWCLKRLHDHQPNFRDAKTNSEKFYALNDASKYSFVLGRIDNACQFAAELFRIAKQYPGTNGPASERDGPRVG